MTRIDNLPEPRYSLWLENGRVTGALLPGWAKDCTKSIYFDSVQTPANFGREYFAAGLCDDWVVQDCLSGITWAREKEVGRCS
jgi:hypothetical protein